MNHGWRMWARRCAEPDGEREGWNGKATEHQQCLRWPRTACVQAHLGCGFRSPAVARERHRTLDHPPRRMSGTFGSGHLSVSPKWPWRRYLVARVAKGELWLSHPYNAQTLDDHLVDACDDRPVICLPLKKTHPQQHTPSRPLMSIKPYYTIGYA